MPSGRCAGSGRAITMASSRFQSFFISCLLAPESTSARGMPLASLKTCRLLPHLLRSVEFFPVSSVSPNSPFFPAALSRCIHPRSDMPTRYQARHPYFERLRWRANTVLVRSSNRLERTRVLPIFTHPTKIKPPPRYAHARAAIFCARGHPRTRSKCR